MKLTPVETLLLSPAVALLTGYYLGHLKITPTSPEHQDYMDLVDNVMTKINIEIEGDSSHLSKLADKITDANLSL